MYNDYYIELEEALSKDNVAQAIYIGLQADFKVSPRLLDLVCKWKNKSCSVLLDCLCEEKVCIERSVAESYVQHYDHVDTEYLRGLLCSS